MTTLENLLNAMQVYPDSRAMIGTLLVRGYALPEGDELCWMKPWFYHVWLIDDYNCCYDPNFDKLTRWVVENSYGRSLLPKPVQELTTGIVSNPYPHQDSGWQSRPLGPDFQRAQDKHLPDVLYLRGVICPGDEDDPRYVEAWSDIAQKSVQNRGFDSGQLEEYLSPRALWPQIRGLLPLQLMAAISESESATSGR